MFRKASTMRKIKDFDPNKINPNADLIGMIGLVATFTFCLLSC